MGSQSRGDEDIRGNLQHILDTIRRTAEGVGRNPAGIRLVAATKHVDSERVRLAYEAGIHVCGENRLQEAQSKMEALRDLPGLAWHFIGRIQRRKIRSLVGRFALIHSVESVEQAEEVNRNAERAGVRQAVLLEVNVGGEESKGGFAPDDLLSAIPLLDQCCHLHIRGLMAIPPRTPNPEQARPYFRQLYDWSQRIARLRPRHLCMEELSMGMTHDYPVAIEEGATMVRIGTGIFGERHL